jgi:hypothetical protein
VRRYLCQACEVACTVIPAALWPRRLFSACAIALALGLWGLEHQAGNRVRDAVSPWPSRGFTAPSVWTSLRRWAAAVRRGELFRVRRCPASFSLREVAARAATTLSAQTPPEPRLLAYLAFLGALAR